MPANETTLEGASWLALTNWTEGLISRLYASMTMIRPTAPEPVTSTLSAESVWQHYKTTKFCNTWTFIFHRCYD